MISTVKNGAKRKIFEENERFQYRFIKEALLLSETPLVRLQSRTPKNHKILWFFSIFTSIIDFEILKKHKNR